MNLDACRVGTSKAIPAGLSKGAKRDQIYTGGWKLDSRDNSGWNPNIGRFPANVIVRVAVQSAFPEVEGDRSGSLYAAGQSLGLGLHSSGAGTVYQDSTLSASRFFKNLVK